MILFAILSLVLAAPAARGQSLTGREIAQRVHDRPEGDSRYSEMTMRLISKKGKERERRLYSWSMDVGDRHQDSKMLMFFDYPADVRGTGFLAWNYDEIGKDDDRWLYLPAMKKTRRISGSSAKRDYFMGSDFTYDDLGSRNVDEDDHTLLREEERDGHLCWVVESVSKDKRDIYARKVSWIRQDCLVPLRVEYYDRHDHLQRELVLSEVEQVDGYWLAKRLHMTNVQKKTQTILEIQSPRYDLDLEENSFVVGKLPKGRL
ncbi:outer membrane lipoprotein-sorting protein [bacterium DOLZORAL124_64_63]|nr:MAG: outer membrane lipoprotein-sorting protein [bacterium DOLZORAL124_64_63]